MVFVDTSFWIALQNDRDAHHEEARLLLISHEAAQLATSNLVCGETWTYLNRRRGHAAAVRFLDLVDSSPRVTVLRIEEQTEARATHWLRAHNERQYSFVDATTFALMKERKMTKALAFDYDFTAAGFVELRP